MANIANIAAWGGIQNICPKKHTTCLYTLFNFSDSFTGTLAARFNPLNQQLLFSSSFSLLFKSIFSGSVLPFNRSQVVSIMC